MTPSEAHEAAADLLAVQEQIAALLEQAQMIIRNTPVESRAEAYWVGHMKAALGGFGYSSMCSMEDTVAELEAICDEEEDIGE